MAIAVSCLEIAWKNSAVVHKFWNKGKIILHMRYFKFNSFMKCHIWADSFCQTTFFPWFLRCYSLSCQFGMKIKHRNVEIFRRRQGKGRGYCWVFFVCFVLNHLIFLQSCTTSHTHLGDQCGNKAHKGQTEYFTLFKSCM